MSCDEPYRPRLHFAAKKGWINDPNGLIRVDDEWHLFYQHQPYSIMHGPMHWGHASSQDLAHWFEHPIALYPDALGTCFSGSAVQTKTGDIKLLYTAHRKDASGSELQVQCLVHADRQFTAFTRESSNPVVANPGLIAFRDPKVFWHAPTSRWVMVLTHGQSIGIRSSTDLIDWRFESEFGAGQGQHGEGPWECPDLFPLSTGDSESRWILMVGIGTDGPGGGSGTQYFVGQFNGCRFVNENEPGTVLWVDHGRDYYAAQSFAGARDITTMAWASNWQYASQTPTKEFRGVMALPRRLTLARTRQGLRLEQHIVPSAASAFESVESGANPRTGTYRVRAHYNPAKKSALTVALFGDPTPIITVSSMGERIVQVRTRRGSDHGIQHFEHDYAIDLPTNGELDIDLFVDNGVVEFSVGGLLWLTNLYFPETPAGRVVVSHRSTGDEQPGSGAAG